MPTISKKASNGRSRAYHHGHLREAALASAQAILRHEGVAALSLRRVAAEVGVSPMALYNHFENRQALLEALAEAGFMALGKAILRAAPRGQPPLRRLRRGAVAYVVFAVEHRYLFELMFGGVNSALARDSPVRSAAAESFSTLRDCLADCARKKLLSVDPIAAERAIWSAAHGYAALWNSVPALMRGTPQQIATNAGRMLDALLSGIARPRAPS
ncbi:MAG: TetR/AcrR family transcriptional regulator [Myxococcota bacterium]